MADRFVHSGSWNSGDLRHYHANDGPDVCQAPVLREHGRHLSVEGCACNNVNASSSGDGENVLQDSGRVRERE